MQRADFHYELPPELIAQHPPVERTGGRLLNVVEGGAPVDAQIRDLPGLLRDGDLLVFNDTRVVPARLHARKDSGGRVEVFLERLLDGTRGLFQLKASKPTRAGSLLTIENGPRLHVRDVQPDGLYLLEAADGVALQDVLARHGQTPLPPYIARAADMHDAERYQTVFARRPGAVAAPTAGLHFDDALLAAIAARGVVRAAVTLHVGAGTFQPVRVEDLETHRMHAEWSEVPAATVAAVQAARARGGRVVAVGTTAVRALESAAAAGTLAPFAGDTRLFIRPGFRFRVVDCLLTNFHLPESTLLMLVSAFAGHDRVMAAYRHAVAARYRFFSYGDAMWLTVDPAARGSC